MLQKKYLIAICFALLTCLIWSGNFIIARGVHDWIPPISLAFWRWFIALIILVPLSFKKLKDEWSHINKSLGYLFVMGLTGVGLFNTVIYFAGKYTTANNLAIIMATAPILTIFFACIFRVEKFSKAKSAGAILAFLGTLFMISKGDLASALNMAFNRGDILVSLSAFIWGSWNVALVVKPKEISTLSFLCVIVAFGVLSLTPFYIFERMVLEPINFNLNVLGIFLYIGALASVLAWFLWQKAVEALGSVKANLIYYSIPVFAAFSSFFILGEELQYFHYLAFALVFSGVLVSGLNRDIR
ncbi:MAG: DMT family transporter [Candidatus Caenarcaniphilales bacterium]|nr:DMT family transporter [Candidatus Caenarcaniphilales bacterium]